MWASWLYTPLAKLSCLSTRNFNKQPKYFSCFLVEFLCNVGRVEFSLVQAVSWLHKCSHNAFPPFPPTYNQPKTSTERPPHYAKHYHVLLSCRLYIQIISSPHEIWWVRGVWANQESHSWNLSIRLIDRVSPGLPEALLEGEMDPGKTHHKDCSLQHSR